MNKQLMRLAGTATATASVMIAMAGSAEAITVRSYQNVATGTCMDSNSAGEAYTLACNSGAYQNWKVTGTDSATVLTNRGTGLCLDSNAAGRVYTLSCNGGAFQAWTVLRFTDGSIRFRNNATGLTLVGNTGRAAALTTRAWNGGANQKWRRIDV